MLYYKVKKSSDRVPIGILFSNTFLVVAELYTPAEINKAIANGWLTPAEAKIHFDRKEIATSDTYFSFGGRFQTKLTFKLTHHGTHNHL